ncbi:hypothetical protein AVM11_12565 [Sphingomonas melonis TY]|uniref:Uncharacterized protein n=1 Tax=Sphingomonas melonis TY TaxID=621456 RepID=A0A175Y8E1_9SPHN|nr:hypothetical protein BJP26_11140 [Sphingomonas melonis TY]ATI55096.1 hypothetical protein CP552_05125 [Sphingomonas melonis]KZB96529.1 hypothetical protein AVM11_12565 [Sphingomonas melonis TY]MBI0532835.1 hypothetical protein [Sphingomonas sp. TX0522]
MITRRRAGAETILRAEAQRTQRCSVQADRFSGHLSLGYERNEGALRAGLFLSASSAPLRAPMLLRVFARTHS